MLKNKKYASIIQSFEMRRDSVVQFLSLVAPQLRIKVNSITCYKREAPCRAVNEPKQAGSIKPKPQTKDQYLFSLFL